MLLLCSVLMLVVIFSGRFTCSLLFFCLIFVSASSDFQLCHLFSILVARDIERESTAICIVVYPRHPFGADLFDAPQNKYRVFRNCIYIVYNYNFHAHEHIAGAKAFSTIIDLIYVSNHPRVFSIYY